MSNKAEQYIDALTAEGSISFTAKQFIHDLDISYGTGKVILNRLSKQKKIISPSKGYYLILTPEFRKKGCLPADFFIDDLMQHLNKNYYVSLLSAALYYGAAHQQPQIFQVMLESQKRNLVCGNIHLEFIKNSNCNITPIKKLNTRTGYMNISTPEATAMDMMNYIRQCGGMSRVITVIDELAESLSKSSLIELAKISKNTIWVYRLGFLLDRLGYNKLAASLHRVIMNEKSRLIPLVPYESIGGAPRDEKWRIVINTALESDLDDSN